MSRHIPAKFMQRALFILMATMMATACAPRYLSPEEAAMNRAAILGASEKQALENARALYPVQPAQHAQGIKKRTVKGYGVTVTVAGEWVTVDGKPAALDANENGNKTYSQGLNTVILYKNGKVALLREGQFVGWLK